MGKSDKWLEKSLTSREGGDAGRSHPLPPRGDQARVRVAQEDDVILTTTDRTGPGISLPGFGVLVLSFFLFKAGVMTWLGQEDYQIALGKLENGSVFDQVAAFIMNYDAFSVFLADQFQGVL